MKQNNRNLFFETMVRGIFLKTIDRKFLDFLKKTLPKLIRRIKNKVDKIIAKQARKILVKNSKINNNKILFMTFQNSFTCNPKYVALDLLKRKKDYDLIWVVDKKTDLNTIPIGIRTVRRNSYDFFKEISTSKIWIDNAMNCIWERIPKKIEQSYIQLWHGSLGFKRFGKEFDKNKVRLKKSSYANIDTNYCIVNSKFEENVFKSTYWPDVECLFYGHARNDILFCNDEKYLNNLKTKIFDKYKIENWKKIVLYAPTFRDDKKIHFFDIDYDRLSETLSKKFGGDWIVLSKLHFHNVKTKVREQNDNVRNVTNYADIQELMAISDIAITDYSSWICDFVLTKRPGFLYTPDYNSYLDERGFYYPLESTPFPISINNDELIKNILEFDDSLYKKNVKDFLGDKECIDDGRASERIVDKIVEIIEKNNL